MASKSHALFRTTIARSQKLMGAADYFQNTDPALAEDLCRSALVLGVAAFDSFFADRFSESFTSYVKQFGQNKDLIEVLGKAKVDIGVVLDLLRDGDRPFRSLRNSLERGFQTNSTQNLDAIDELYLGFRLADFSNHVQRKTGKAKLVTKVKKAISRRHKIAHAGDVHAHGRPQKLSIPTVKTWLQVMDTFVTGADELIDSKLKVVTKGRKKRTAAKTQSDLPGIVSSSP